MKEDATKEQILMTNTADARSQITFFILFAIIGILMVWLMRAYLGVIAMIPAIAFVLLGTAGKFPFGGTSILIIVGVGLDTVKQIQSQLQQRNYEGFLR